MRMLRVPSPCPETFLSRSARNMNRHQFLVGRGGGKLKVISSSLWYSPQCANTRAQEAEEREEREWGAF